MRYEIHILVRILHWNKFCSFAFHS